MPVYDYRCEKGHRFEVVQSMSDSPLDKCEECGAPAQRVLHAPAIHFKGSGFHNTDYGTRQRPKDADGGSPSGGEKTAAPGAGSSGGSSGGGTTKTVGLNDI